MRYAFFSVLKGKVLVTKVISFIHFDVDNILKHKVLYIVMQKTLRISFAMVYYSERGE